MKNWKETGISTLLLLAICFCPSGIAEKVCKVQDGDTFTTCDGKKIRIFGIDAPELKQPFGRASKNYLLLLTSEQEISLQCSGKSFKRKICRIWIPTASGQDLDLGQAMVSGGLAFDYSSGTYATEQAFAQRERRGVWFEPTGGVRPWEFRSRGFRK